jgi:hypothetical protein
VDKGSMRAVVIDSMHYILNGDRREELYDFLTDRVEQSDLSRTAEADGRRPRDAPRQSAPGAHTQCR